MEFSFTLLLLLTPLVLPMDLGSAAQRLQPRTLIYPPTSPTRIQFIGGIGIPVEDLAYESVTSGYVLKAEYFLPTEAHALHPTYQNPQNIHGRSFHNNNNNNKSSSTDNADAAVTIRQLSPGYKRQRSNFNDNWQSKQAAASTFCRWIIYQGIETVLNSSGLPGRTCLLRSICEHAALPLHYGSGILAEILHIVLRPSTSTEQFARSTDADYLHAEAIGLFGALDNCEHAYRSCAKSPIDLISTIFDTD